MTAGLLGSISAKNSTPCSNPRAQQPLCAEGIEFLAQRQPKLGAQRRGVDDGTLEFRPLRGELVADGEQLHRAHGLGARDQFLKVFDGGGFQFIATLARGVPAFPAFGLVGSAVSVVAAVPAARTAPLWLAEA